tara:strand:+ start:40286 stop:40666 length:381 start_codon:yes stop_codon:yes gene_type:complete
LAVDLEIKRSSEIKHTIPSGRSSDDYPYALSDKIFSTKQLSLYSEKVRPGTKASAPHFHKDLDEIIYVTKGTLEAVEGESRVTLSKGDSVCFYAGSGEKHYLENNTDSDSEFLIFKMRKSIDDVAY